MPIVLWLAWILAAPGAERADGWTAPIAVTGEIDGVRATHSLRVYLPKGYGAAEPERRWPWVVVLHGWNHSAELVREKSTLAAEADRLGLVLVVPDMGTSVYETAMFPETQRRRAWSRVPGTRWVGEVVLPYAMTHLAVRQDRGGMGIIGYSTGGRGAMMVAARYHAFGFVGSASGTFDLMRLTPKSGEYEIHALVYGPRRRFSERWAAENVIGPRCLPGLFGLPLFVTHGLADRVVAADQVAALRDALGDSDDAVLTWRLVEGAGHDWAFWNASWGPMLDSFFLTPPR